MISIKMYFKAKIRSYVYKISGVDNGSGLEWKLWTGIITVSDDLF